MPKKKNPIPQKIKSAFQKIENFLNDKRVHVVFGVSLLFIAVFFTGAFVSFLLNWEADQSEISGSFWQLFVNPDLNVQNIFGRLGAVLGHQFIHRWFGISAFIVNFYLFAAGLKIALGNQRLKLGRMARNTLFILIWIPTFLSLFLSAKSGVLAGGIGFSISNYLKLIVGTPGTWLLLGLTLFTLLTLRLKLTPDRLKRFITKTNHSEKENQNETPTDPVQKVNPSAVLASVPDEINQQSSEEQPTESVVEIDLDNKSEGTKKEVVENNNSDLEIEIPKEESQEDISLNVDPVNEDDSVSSDKKVNKILKDFGVYDPTLELSKFQLPGIQLLLDHGSGNIKIDQAELEANKNKIVDTLQNYKIDISKIKATIGPTVTLYEIVPAAGVRISKIKNLEDDIALSLSALGIRIIAPIPGRGTIGIEVPNNEPSTIGMKQVLSSEKFLHSKMELPIALGKTISNETFVTDLAKMPHLLMAGATGQGKSVGLNAILASILYKKHPSQVKFVLVDPKKVELTLFNKIERHYLAKLPDTEEAIITDTSKVVTTLNSLCIEMDNRYDLLKNAMVRNIKEYNEKFINRRLNPEEGHRFLPYIVLVIDEFADLIMTAGKEVETPIARLAQLARAIGIHLIIATQRPSVNVITGIIKANFPARIAFRVTSKIDSRTILDQGGADQLIGKGDLLYTSGSDLIRIQCAFIDTPEVEKITEFIGSQKAYPTAYELPEYVGEEGSAIDGIDPDDRDVMFEDAARIIVIHQQGSASLLQRKLKLGYNRAGRIIDQLEAAGIIGPFEGSKARQVLVPDEMALEQILNK